MATERTKAELETFYETGDIPTESQFADWINSYENLKDGNLIVGNENNITAFAGGGQANATQLTKKINNVTTVASAFDSVKLPVALMGRMIIVRDSGIDNLRIFPAVGEEIDSFGINTGHDVPPAGGSYYICVKSGVWSFTLLA